MFPAYFATSWPGPAIIRLFESENELKCKNHFHDFIETLCLFSKYWEFSETLYNKLIIKMIIWLNFFNFQDNRMTKSYGIFSSFMFLWLPLIKCMNIIQASNMRISRGELWMIQRSYRKNKESLLSDFTEIKAWSVLARIGYWVYLLWYWWGFPCDAVIITLIRHLYLTRSCFVGMFVLCLRVRMP